MKEHQPESIRVFNISILNTTIEEMFEKFTNGCLFTPNIDHLVLMQSDEEFYKAYCDAEFVVLDSQVIYLLWKLRRESFRAKVSGADFFPLYCKFHENNESVRIFLLGGLDGVARMVQDQINDHAGRQLVVASYSPPPDFENDLNENEKIISIINSSEANMLAVALGTPKQEKWIYFYRSKLTKIESFMGIGATLDFMAGKQKRAPILMQKIGLEWLYRLIRDPKRLCNRYLIRDIKFFYYFGRELLNIYHNPFEK